MRNDRQHLGDAEKLFSVVLEDDESLAAGYERVLKSLGYDVALCHRITDARAVIRDKAPDLLLIDIDLPDGNGLDLMDELRNDTHGRFIVISGDTSQRAAIKSIRHRAVELLLKPVSLNQLRETLTPRDKAWSAVAHERGDSGKVCWIMQGSCPALSALRTAMSFSAEQSRGHALIVGETGVEKPEVAMELHRRGRRAGACIVVDCSNEKGEAGMVRLFGQEDPKTGEIIHEGYLDQAASGTLVLDYVEQLSVDSQSRLMTLLDSGQFKRVGASNGARVTVALVGIARESGTTDIDETALRSDFLVRLAKTTLVVPSLRQCSEDIIPIANYLLRVAARNKGIDVQFSDKAKAKLETALWPRNVRELRSVIERALLSVDESGVLDIGSDLLPEQAGNSKGDIEPWVGTTVWEMERQLLYATLAHHDGDKALTAKTLGVSLKTLYNRMNAY